MNIMRSPHAYVAVVLIASATQIEAQVPVTITTQHLTVVGQAKFDLTPPQTIDLPRSVATAHLAVVGQGSKFGLTPVQTIDLPKTVTTEKIQVIGTGPAFHRR